MSTLKVNTLQNTSGVEVYTAKAWVNFNGTGTVAIRASGNVSSITDNGVGDYTVNFTNAMSDANYSTVVTNGNYATTASTGRVSEAQGATTNSVKAISFLCTTGARTDYDFMNVAIFR